MNGTLPQKLTRLTGNLFVNPRYLSRYVVHNVINGKTPVELELPWFSYAAIDFLDKFVKPAMRVCEYGSGGSTIFFAERAASVVSVENDPQWHEVVARRLQEKGINNATLKLCPFDFKNPVGFEYSQYLHAIPDDQYDIIVVDGSEEWQQVRPVCFSKAETHIRKGGIIVVDDSWRYPGIRRQNRASHFEVFQSVGPCRPGVTSTDVFFY
jgi:protein-L-isoaspartate O-methyltransferase